VKTTDGTTLASAPAGGAGVRAETTTGMSTPMSMIETAAPATGDRDGARMGPVRTPETKGQTDGTRTAAPVPETMAKIAVTALLGATWRVLTDLASNTIAGNPP